VLQPARVIAKMLIKTKLTDQRRFFTLFSSLS
jgi:hypothetical protein